MTTSPNTRFDVQFQNFPYTIDDNDDYQAYALRLVPLVGAIEAIELREEASVAINLLKTTPENLLADTDNGTLRVELYYKPVMVSTPLRPPGAYNPRVVIPR